MSFWDSSMECAPSDVRADYQMQALRKHVSRTAKLSPFYAGRLSVREITSVEDYFAAVEPVTKLDILADAAENPPYGNLLAVPPTDLVRLFVHPGPQVMAWTANDQQAIVNMYAQGISTVGFDATDLVDVTFQYAWVMAGLIWDAAVQRIGAAAAPGGAGGTIEHLENLRSLRLTGLMGFPTYLEEIGVRAREQGIDLAVDKLLVIGEMRGQDAKERLRDLYGASWVREGYGTAEAGLVAAECGDSNGGMHVHQDIIIEVRDPVTGALVEEGQSGELYLTPLGREAMPLLRFKTGDITEYLQTEPCPCGRTSPRMGRILGRASDLFRVKGVFLAPAVVTDVVTDGGRRPCDYRIVISRPELKDHIALQLAYDGEDAAAVTEVVRQRFKERCRVSVDIEVVRVGTLPEGTRAIEDHR